MSRYERNVADPDFDTARDEAIDSISLNLRPAIRKIKQLFASLVGANNNEKSGHEAKAEQDTHTHDDPRL